MGKNDPKHRFPDLRDAIRQKGLRATPARVAVLRVLREADRPLSHAEVFEALAGSDLDKATVYRNLTDLAHAGLLQRSAFGDRIWRFSEQSGHEATEHPHFVCVECGAVQCLPGVTMNLGKAGKRLGHRALEVQLRGRCGDCS